jgi:hypothetical protein
MAVGLRTLDEDGGNMLLRNVRTSITYRMNYTKYLNNLRFRNLSDGTADDRKTIKGNQEPVASREIFRPHVVGTVS